MYIYREPRVNNDWPGAAAWLSALINDEKMEISMERASAAAAVCNRKKESRYISVLGSCGVTAFQPRGHLSDAPCDKTPGWEE